MTGVCNFEAALDFMAFIFCRIAVGSRGFSTDKTVTARFWPLLEPFFRRMT